MVFLFSVYIGSYAKRVGRYFVYSGDDFEVFRPQKRHIAPSVNFSTPNFTTSVQAWGVVWAIKNENLPKFQ